MCCGNVLCESGGWGPYSGEGSDVRSFGKVCGIGGEKRVNEEDSYE